MKVYSISQPYASLSAHGMKIFETRGWHAPQSIIGQVIGIAATKRVLPDARSSYDTPEFQQAYSVTGLPPLEELPCAVLVGTALLHSVELVTEDFLEDVSEIERAFGWFEIGGYAWRLRYAKPLAYPIPISGKQGFYDWHGLDPKADPVGIDPSQGAQAQGSARILRFHLPTT